MWRVKDFADGWIYFNDEEAAKKDARETGALLQTWDIQAIGGWLGDWVDVPIIDGQRET